MNKVFGKKECYAPVREDASRVIVSYGFNEETDGANATWLEIYFYKKQGRPDFKRARQAILEDINDQTREKIISGFVWNDNPVWLSVENQLNFAQGVAPVTFKIGETAEGEPVYHEFATDKELAAFWKECAQWRQQCLDEGNRRKESFDFTPYEQELKIEE